MHISNSIFSKISSIFSFQNNGHQYCQQLCALPKKFMNRNKKIKQVKELLPPLITGVSKIYLHPYHFFFVIFGQDNYLKIFDIPTMSLVAQKIEDKDVHSLKSELKCLFTTNPNIFYLFSLQQIYIRKYEIIPGGIKSSKPYPVEVPWDDLVLQCGIAQSDKVYFEILVERGILIYDVSSDQWQPLCIQFYEPIHKGIPLSKHKWLIFSRNCISLTSFYFNREIIQQSSIKIQSQIFQQTQKNVKIFHHESKRLVGFLTSQNFFCVIQYDAPKQHMQVVCRIPFTQNNQLINFTFFSYNLNANTSHKYQNKVLMVMLTSNTNQMIDQKQQGKRVIPMIFSLDLISQTYKSEIQSQQIKESQLISQLSNAIDLWYCEMISNKLCTLNSKGDVMGLDMTILLQGNIQVKQWINLGYKFEALSINAIYEEFPRQFEERGLINKKKQLDKNDLQDWSYSQFPKQIVFQRVHRLNCFQF